jgi:flagellar protein FliS
MSASPHQLISMLFDGAGTAIRAAALHMREGQVAEKGKAISKALDIVNNGLLAALDREKGGELADRMASLYDYIARLLLNANLRNDPASLDEAGRLLRTWVKPGTRSNPPRIRGLNDRNRIPAPGIVGGTGTARL